jgi:hypothetical protein
MQKSNFMHYCILSDDGYSLKKCLAELEIHPGIAEQSKLTPILPEFQWFITKWKLACKPGEYHDFHVISLNCSRLGFNI